MSKIAVIPDTHLQARMMLPIIASKLKDEGIKPDKYVFLGDYFDQWHVNDYDISQKEVQTLSDFAENHECIFLLGNHDIPYVTTDLRHYSDPSPKTCMLYQKALVDMGASLAYEEGDFLFSHAGFVRDRAYEVDFTKLTHDNFYDMSSYLTQVLNDAGRSSGGYALVPSSVWARPDEWTHELNPEYTHQVVGHTPQRTIDRLERGDSQIHFCDTFSLGIDIRTDKKTGKNYRHYYAGGDGSFLVVDTSTNNIQKLTPEWKNTLTNPTDIERNCLFYGDDFKDSVNVPTINDIIKHINTDQKGGYCL